MRAIDIILKKRSGQKLTKSEIEFLVKGYVAKEIPDYQISAFLMAVYFQKMDPEETAILTRTMIESGKKLDFSFLGQDLVDKHSTGGVGDKTSFIIAPILAALGLYVPMMSGRALGHTGGTLDKLESIEGYRVFLTEPEVRTILAENGFVMMGQTKEIVPADKLLYALRDASGTVEEISLITASILSKKIAEGSQGLVMDVKTGSGAFMKTLEQSDALARSLLNSAKSFGLPIRAVISNMDEPLGDKIGNFLEIEEIFAIFSPEQGVYTIEIENGQFKATGNSRDLIELSLELSAHMYALMKKASMNEAREKVLVVLQNGEARNRFLKNIVQQGGDLAKLKSQLGKRRPPFCVDIRAEETGYIARIDARICGELVVKLGGGRNQSSDDIDHEVGIHLLKKSGSPVNHGELIAKMWARSEKGIEENIINLQKAFSYSIMPKTPDAIILKEYT